MFLVFFFFLPHFVLNEVTNETLKHIKKIHFRIIIFNVFVMKVLVASYNKYTEIFTLAKTVPILWYECAWKGLNTKVERWSQNMVYDFEFAKWEKWNQRSHLMKMLLFFFHFCFVSWNKKFILKLWEWSKINALIIMHTHTRTHIIQWHNNQSTGRFGGKRDCQKRANRTHNKSNCETREATMSKTELRPSGCYSKWFSTWNVMETNRKWMKNENGKSLNTKKRITTLAKRLQFIPYSSPHLSVQCSALPCIIIWAKAEAKRPLQKYVFRAITPTI